MAHGIRDGLNYTYDKRLNLKKLSYQRYGKLYIPNKIKINKIDTALKHFFIFSTNHAIFDLI